MGLSRSADLKQIFSELIKFETLRFFFMMAKSSDDRNQSVNEANLRALHLLLIFTYIKKT